MRVTQNQLRRIIKEEKEKVLDEIEVDLENPSGANGDHHWPRVEWSNVYDLVDKWQDMEQDAFDISDPSMTDNGELSQKEARDWWYSQVEAGSIDLEAELTQEIRKAALKAMKSISDKLVNGDYA